MTDVCTVEEASPGRGPHSISRSPQNKNIFPINHSASCHMQLLNCQLQQRKTWEPQIQERLRGHLAPHSTVPYFGMLWGRSAMPPDEIVRPQSPGPCDALSKPSKSRPQTLRTWLANMGSADAILLSETLKAPMTSCSVKTPSVL